MSTGARNAELASPQLDAPVLRLLGVAAKTNVVGTEKSLHGRDWHLPNRRMVCGLRTSVRNCQNAVVQQNGVVIDNYRGSLNNAVA